MSTNVYLRTGATVDTHIRPPSSAAFRNEELLRPLHQGPLPVSVQAYGSVPENAATLLDIMAGGSPPVEVSLTGVVAALVFQVYGRVDYLSGPVTFNRTRLDAAGRIQLGRILDMTVNPLPPLSPAPPPPSRQDVEGIILAFLGMGRIGRSFPDPGFRLDLTARLNSLVQGVAPGLPQLAQPFPLSDAQASEPIMLQVSAALDIIASLPGTGLQSLRFGTIDTAGEGQATLGMISLLDGMAPGESGVAPWIFSGAAAAQLAELLGPGNPDDLANPNDIGVYACPLSGGGVSIYGGSQSPDLFGILALAGCGVGNTRCINGRPPGTPSAPLTLMLNAGALAYCCARGTLDVRFAPVGVTPPAPLAPQAPQPGQPPTASSPFWEWAQWLKDQGTLPPDCLRYLQTVAAALANPRQGSFGEEFVNLVAML